MRAYLHYIGRAWLAAGLFVSGCGDTQPDDGVGGYQCDRDDHCWATAPYGVEPLGRPARAPAALESSSCEPATIPIGFSKQSRQAIVIGTGDDAVCLCESAESRNDEFLFDDKTDNCLAFSRSRQCLFASSDFPGCDVQRPDTSCQTVCEDLTRLRAEDAGRTFDASVRSNRCLEHTCQYVVEIEGLCYANHYTDVYDCALSDDEILKRDAARIASMQP